MKAVARRYRFEFGFELRNARDELIVRHGHGPLRHVLEVARGEWQQQAGAAFPDAVAVAEAGEGASVPVFNNADPVVAEPLAVLTGFEAAVETHHIRMRGRLASEAGVLQRNIASKVVPPIVFFRSTHRRQNRLVRRGEVTDRQSFLNRLDVDFTPEHDRIPAIGIAFATAMESLDEERALRLYPMALRLPRHRRAFDGRSRRVDVNPHPAVGRHRGRHFHNHQIGRGGEAFLVPIGSRRKRQE